MLLLAPALAAAQEGNATAQAAAGASDSMRVPLSFFIFGAVIIIGFFSNLVFEKTMIPDPLILIMLGIFLGPATHIADPALFQQIAPFFAPLALVIILFDGGINIRFEQLLEGIPRATLLGVVNLIFSIIAAVAVTSAFSLPPVIGLLLGAIVGGTSSAIVISLMNKIKTDETTATLLNLESAVTDGLTVVTAIAIMQFMLMSAQTAAAGAATQSPLIDAAHNLASGFSIGAMVGLLTGILWLVISKHFAGHVFVYMIVVALIFIVYALTEFLRGNGAIGVLVYGLVLGNGREFVQFFRLRNVLFIDKDVRFFHREISFFVRTFFFVYLGILISVPNLGAPDLALELRPFIIGALISIGLVVARYLASVVSMKGSEFEPRIWLSTVMLPRGLAAAVLAQMPRGYGLEGIPQFPGVEMVPTIVFTVVLLTIMICTVGVYRLSRGHEGPEPAPAAPADEPAAEEPEPAPAPEHGEARRRRAHERPAALEE